MKRRAEESVKIVDTSGGYSPHPSIPVSPPRHPPRILTTVSQSNYGPPIKQTSDLRSIQGFPAFTSNMPAVAPSIKVHGGSMTPPGSSTLTPAQQQQQIQRLKVEDALSYLDMVKYKFGDQPQVYNDFLDIMKEFKSQSIDTPGVIDRVSNLFKGHPELIVGFNTFLPPGYKIEVKTNEQGYSFQVQVSIPSPSSGTTTMVPTVSTVHHTAQLASTPLPVATTVVTKSPLVVSNTTIVTHSNNGPTPVVTATPVPSTTPPHHAPPTMTEVAVSQALSHVDGVQAPTPQSQPVEFNHAINYVNKIKNRFQGQPDKYKRFLEILHTYQKEQRNLKEGMNAPVSSPGTKQLTEAEVYSQVAKLFEHQEDLLAEFGQFLPDATNHQTQLPRRCEEPPVPVPRKPPASVKINSPFNNNAAGSPSPSPVTAVATPPVPKVCPSVVHAPTPPPIIPQVEAGASPVHKRSPPSVHNPLPSTSQLNVNVIPPKKQKLSSYFRDVTLADAAKFGSLTDFSFFDKVRKALRSQDVYENFLRCINLFTQEVVSGGELMQMITPFLGQSPELFRWFKEYMGYAESPLMLPLVLASPPHSSDLTYDSILNNITRTDRPGSEQSEIDFSVCKRLGASYCALPRNHQPEKCSGRTALCREVLNDTWVSFPTWSEESTFVTSRKTQYEEYIYRCEDERFELDVVLEVNAATIRVLEAVQKKLCRLSAEETAKFTLDDCLGGNSPTIHQRAINRIYGDKGPDIVDGLKRNPGMALPLVLKRLKTKDEEWREAQKGFNKIWREQNEKYYLKSLDHQGINFKQNDLKTLRSKTLFNEIEACCDERHEQVEVGDPMALPGPHMTLVYKDKAVLDDAANLLIHHVKRQTGIQKYDKQKIKHMLRQHLPDMFHHPRQELSEDERGPDNKGRNFPSPNISDDSCNHKSRSDERSRREEAEDIKLPIHALSQHPDEEYTLFFGNGHWYLFLRLHHILCERLTHIYDQASALTREEGKFKELRSDAASAALRLKPKCEYLVDVEVEEYYTTFLDMVKNLLDGNMDANAYEDTLREMFGIHAYLAFTLDKVVSYAVRQLQHLVGDYPCTECTALYLKALSRGGAGGLCINAYSRLHAETTYQRKTELAMAEENENCYKFFIYKMNCKLTIELLETEGYDNGKSQRDIEKWSAYVDRYSKSANKEKDDMDIDDDLEAEHERRLWGKAVFLPRNIRLWNERVGSKHNLKIDSCDNTECKFSIKSYKMIFVVDRESYLYKRRALLKARQGHEQLSYRMSAKFHMWHRTWAQNNLTPHQYEFADNWMMGNLPDYKINHTVVLRDNPVDKPPYHSFNRFRVFDKVNK